ncbi:hypothetical protein CF327_g6023 [Tilletia walkeri]|nr:hypothetical protein CF327_g6023 [Tilletia walkeri]
MSARRAVDEDFALRALSMSQHILSPTSNASVRPDERNEEDDTADKSTTVSEHLFMLSKRASDLADTALRAEKEVEVCELDFEDRRGTVSTHAEALAAAQRAANEAQLVLQIRKCEYEDAVAAAHQAHLEYGEFFRSQTELMFASKAIPPRRALTAAGPSSEGFTIEGSRRDTSADTPEGSQPSNKRPRLLESGRGSATRTAMRHRPESISYDAMLTGSESHNRQQVIEGPGANTSGIDPMGLLTDAPGDGDTDPLVIPPDQSVGTSRRSIAARSRRSRGVNGGGSNASSAGGAAGSSSSTNAAANPTNEALPTAPPYFGSSSSATSSTGLASAPSRPPGSQAASLARQLLRAKTSAGIHNLSSSTSSSKEP